MIYASPKEKLREHKIAFPNASTDEFSANISCNQKNEAVYVFPYISSILVPRIINTFLSGGFSLKSLVKKA